MSSEYFETAQISEINGDYALVQLIEQDNCATCGARILCRADNTGQRTLRVKNTVNAQVGEQVQIAESGNLLLKLSVLQYGLPFMGFILGILFAYLFIPTIISIPPEIIYIGTGFLGLGLAGFGSWKWATRLAGKTSSVFQIQKVTD